VNHSRLPIMTLTLAGVAALLTIAPLSPSRAQDQQTAPVMAKTPDEAAYVKTYQHVRMDEEEIVKHGKGSFEQGLNELGERGYELLFVTSTTETGKAGFHYFIRTPYAAGAPRLRFRYKRFDSGSIVQLGGGSFSDGLNKLSPENWELVAITTTSTGNVGWHYFKRVE